MKLYCHYCHRWFEIPESEVVMYKTEGNFIPYIEYKCPYCKKVNREEC